MELTDAQWAVIETLLLEGKSGKGRPRRGNREVLEGILWVLRTGARWRDLPPAFPPYQTCHRRFGQWSLDKTPDGRPLRRCRRRWKVERLFARLHAFRRVVTRREYHLEL